MATPLKGIRSGYEDRYNFYLSQLRITIERAFGVLVHRWAILRAPLTIPIMKVAPLLESLVRLHNFCINKNEYLVTSLHDRNSRHLEFTASISRHIGGQDASVVDIDEYGRPKSLLGLGHHFADAESYHYDRSLLASQTPMDEMIELVATLQKKRPKY